MYYLRMVLIISLIVSVTGYILVVLREKYYLNNNIIVLDNSSVTSEDFEDIDINQMSYKGIRLKTGDEVKIVTRQKVMYQGTLIGGKLKDGILRMVTYSDEIKEIQMDNILKLKLVRAYGKFFTI